MNKYVERLYNGLIKENPTLILMLGMCPTLAVSTRAFNGIGMGLSTTAVLILSNFVISLLRKLIPDQVRLPAFIVVVASMVTVTELLMEAYLPGVYEALGIYIPLIVVNCIILGRAEAYASKNPPVLSIMDGLEMAPDRSSIVSFNYVGQSPLLISKYLDGRGITIRVGTHCAEPLMAYLGTSATCRISLAPYNTLDEIDEIIDVLAEMPNKVVKAVLQKRK